MTETAENAAEVPLKHYERFKRHYEVIEYHHKILDEVEAVTMVKGVMLVLLSSWRSVSVSSLHVHTLKPGTWTRPTENFSDCLQPWCNYHEKFKLFRMSIDEARLP